MSYSGNDAGRRVMPGVRSPEGAGPITQVFRPGARGRPNNGMHATRDPSDVIELYLAGGRVMPSVRFSTFLDGESLMSPSRRLFLCDNPACSGDERQFWIVDAEDVPLPEKLLKRKKDPADVICMCHRCGYTWFQERGYDPGYGRKTPLGFFNEGEGTFIEIDRSFPFDFDRR
jgi:hypothetical protein